MTRPTLKTKRPTILLLLHVYYSSGNASTEPLRSNDEEIFTEPLPSNDREDTQTHTHTQKRDLITLLYF
jgi:hypothetical protein